jgi:hypothetical protein
MPDLTHRWLRVTPHVFIFLYTLFAGLMGLIHWRNRGQEHHEEKP